MERGTARTTALLQKREVTRPAGLREPAAGRAVSAPLARRDAGRGRRDRALRRDPLQQHRLLLRRDPQNDQPGDRHPVGQGDAAASQGRAGSEQQVRWHAFASQR